MILILIILIMKKRQAALRALQGLEICKTYIEIIKNIHIVKSQTVKHSWNDVYLILASKEWGHDYPCDLDAAYVICACFRRLASGAQMGLFKVNVIRNHKLHFKHVRSARLHIKDMRTLSGAVIWGLFLFYFIFGNKVEYLNSKGNMLDSGTRNSLSSTYCS